MAKKSPCTGWVGTDVIEHCFANVTMIQSFAKTGKGPKRNPKVGADPLASWAKLRDDTIEALDQPGVLQTTAVDPFGPEFGSMPVDDLVGFMAADLIVHCWDLARTAKVDERLDVSLCKEALATWKALPEAVLRMPQMFGPAIKPAKGADIQTKLLNFLGRAA